MFLNTLSPDEKSEKLDSEFEKNRQINDRNIGSNTIKKNLMH